MAQDIIVVDTHLYDSVTLVPPDETTPTVEPEFLHKKHTRQLPK
jgi:hypothetical protein